MTQSVKDTPSNTEEKFPIYNFSLTITKASYDKSTNSRRWRAVTSDTDDDQYGDNMTLELFSDFEQRIKSKELPPENYRSDFWAGGMPYLSISHYTDLNGDGVPGSVENVYVDGNRLKALGEFNDSALGRACFETICRDLYSSDPVPDDEKIRISIAFLDYKHRHKDTGYIFERKSTDDLCPECLKAMVTGEYEGREFLRGHLMHFAFTRVPVNPRTPVEVDRAMTTRKEDAASIVGEELAEELEEKQKLVGRSEALVVKSDTEKVEEEPQVEEPVVVPETKVEEEEQPPEEVGDVWQDLSMAINNIMSSKDDKAKLFIDAVESLRSAIVKPNVSTNVEIPEIHPLDGALNELKASYDRAITSKGSSEDKLQFIQESFTKLGVTIQTSVEKSATPNDKPTHSGEMSDVVKALLDVSGKLDLLITQNQAPSQTAVRRSVSPNISMQKDIHAQIRASVGGETRLSNGKLSIRDAVARTT